MAKSEIRDEDRGFIAFRKMIGEKINEVDVGVLTNQEKTKNPKEADKEESITLFEVAIQNEFGDASSKTPERSFIRGWVDQNKKNILARLRSEAIRAVMEKDKNFATALQRIGLWAQSEIQQRISDGIPPQNAQYTINKKGSSTPLVDTGQLRSSISFKVVRR